MSDYLKRDLTATIKELMKEFPCVALLGARQVGKSTLLKKILPKARYFDLENSNHEAIISRDPLFFLEEQKSPLIIDEAQHCPELFPALRVVIDRDRKNNGRYLISGSSSPHLLKNISESLAGRIAIIEVPCLAWHEALQTKKSKFYSILKEPGKFTTLTKLYKSEQLYELMLYGLYPEAFLKRDKHTSYDTWVENYFKTYIERDVRTLFPGLKLDVYKRFIKMLCFSSGEIINASNFARSLDVSQPTIKSYLEIAEGTFIWRKFNCYSKNTSKRLVKMPRGQLRDTTLVNYLLNINSIDDLRAHPQLGRIWESFVIEQILKNLDSSLIKNNSYFYRTHNQNEIDLVIEGRFGLIPIEIKAGLSNKKDHLITLNNFIEEHKCPYGILINLDNEIRKLSPKIYQVPACFI